MSNKEAYIALCESGADIPLFMQPWWLDTVCAGKQWDVLLSYDDNHQIVAAMPYLLRMRWPELRYVVMPQQTQIGGIWLSSTIHDNEQVIHQVVDEMELGIEALHLDYYYQHYPVGSPIPQKLQTLGYRIRQRVTYRLDDLSDLDKVVASFSKNKRRQLQHALTLHVSYDLSAEEFYRFHQQCLQQKRKRITYSRELLLLIDRKSQRHQCGQIIAIRNADEQLVAAALLVWDKHYLYFLIPCYSPAQKDSGAGALLVLESIKIARKQGVGFDFEGSMISGVANHYRQFGSTAANYYGVEKYWSWWFRLWTITNKIREWKMR